MAVRLTIVVGEFEWDSGKASTNEQKHGVTFDEALGVFADPESVELADSVHRERFIVIGYSARSRLLFVVSVERSDRTRIISARKGTKAEARLYEEG